MKRDYDLREEGKVVQEQLKATPDPVVEARIRVQLSAAHEPEHVERAITAFTKVGKQFGVI